MRRLALALAIALLVVPASAAASPDAPFGHACTVRDDGLRFCPTASDDQRVPSFDGTPIDVDVTLPPAGTEPAPFPTIVMMHGFPGTKEGFESATPEGTSAHTYLYNNAFYANQGYAVITLSSRGFGRSCGVPDSRTSPQCDRGWVHPVADQRFEIRDVQHLLGLLVDEGVTQPGRIGVTGTSMGGSMAMQLGFLRNKVRNADGSFGPWTSPAGKAVEIVAAYPRWGISDLEYALLPNGRALDNRTPKRAEGLSPIGVAKESVLKALALGGVVAGYIAPKGADPTADLNGWLETIEAGEPYGADARAIAEQFAEFKGTPGLDPLNAAPLLIQVGWTDPVLPALEAVRPYNRINTAVEGGADIGIQIGDVGHFTGGNPLNQNKTFNEEGAQFFARHLRGQQVPLVVPGQVTAFLQGCPKGSKGSNAIRRPGFPALDRGRFVLSRRSGTVTSSGGDPATAKVVDPVATSDRCTQVKPGSRKGTAVLTRRSPGFTMLGIPTVRTRVTTNGDNGQIDALLWEVLRNGRQRIVDFGVYRLRNDQRGGITFQLQGNGYKFAKGSTVKLELRGRTPGLFRPSNGKFSVKLGSTSLEIPTDDPPNRAKGIVRPRAN
jgi:pimeloyl-ACP methyl ester carboxylesterase